MFDKTSDYLGPFKIMVIEPNPLMRRITVAILRLLGTRKVVEVSNTTAAIPFIRLCVVRSFATDAGVI